MSSLEVPGLDVSGRVRARDIQMAAVADVRRRVIMISGAIDAPDHDVSVSINLPEPGRWQVIKSETNLTDQTWVAMEVTTDEDSHFAYVQKVAAAHTIPWHPGGAPTSSPSARTRPPTLAPYITSIPSSPPDPILPCRTLTQPPTRSRIMNYY